MIQLLLHFQGQFEREIQFNPILAKTRKVDTYVRMEKKIFLKQAFLFASKCFF